MALDRQGDTKGAASKYEEAARVLQEAAGLAAAAHPEDAPKLEQHRSELLQRAEHLKGLKEGQTPTIPLEQQVHAVQLGMQAASSAQAATSAAGGLPTMAAAAGVGAVGGFLVLGGIVGATAAVVAGGAAAAYASTRQDQIGEAARGVGNMTLAAGQKAKAINQEHQITDKAVAMGKAAVEKAKEVDNKYSLVDKAKEGVSKGVQSAKEFENKYHVTDKIASGVSKGLSKATDLMSKRPGSAEGGTANAASAASTGAS